ncbi:uncharacterized protein LOC113542717 [Pangasianodon hypophthalmus]|uniref:uncharacterized protein LOC113542717 n=1 Tax=Pangasianodon hypophthalmus TaxID=310915 RepID=UPI002307C137|nr:uncharacterized protein LOC113542717 [Pangasianodon hypophthalmus]
MQYTDLRPKMMVMLWITVMLFNKTDSAQKNIVHQPKLVITATAGDNVTLHCFLLGEENIDPMVWYKQAGGHEPSLLAVIQKGQDPIYKDELNSPRFRIERGSKSCHLRIINVKLSDEAMYYCGLGTFLPTFAKGTFLSVKDKPELKVSVLQSSVLDSVPAGASVTLQCSVLSESRAADLQVLWFRAAPPQSHPQIIYTHHNSSHQCESGSSTHTCVYNFSKNISHNDTGTYYCAVAVCGKIIFGNGTRVQQENCATAFNPVVICLGTALVMCGILISAQAVLLCKSKNCQQYRERFQHGAVTNTEKTNAQNQDAVELNYAALHFNEKKRARENRGRSQGSVYSEVKSSTITHLNSL